MKIRLKIHPDDFDKTANEEFYEKMASEGWLLKKRWSNLSKFKKTEPQKLKFDIYYSEDNYVSDEEKAEFEASGRTVVNVKSNVHVSYSPKNAALSPVIKSNEDAAKAIIPLKNKSTSHLTPLIILILLLIYLHTAIIRDITYNAFSVLPFIQNTLYKIITVPELYIVLIALLAYDIFILLYEHMRWKKAVKVFLNGDNPDNGHKKKIIYIFNLFVIISIIFISLSAYSNITRTEYETPQVSDGLYLDVQDFGIDDKITSTGLNVADKYIPNKITHVKTLSAQMWITQEHYNINDTRVTVYQDVIKYKSQKTALYSAELLMSDKYENYSKLNADGFDMAYSADESFIAVIDSTVYRVAIITTDESLVPPTEKLLGIILSKKE